MAVPFVAPVIEAVTAGAGVEAGAAAGAAEAGALGEGISAESTVAKNLAPVSEGSASEEAGATPKNPSKGESRTGNFLGGFGTRNLHAFFNSYRPG